MKCSDYVETLYDLFDADNDARMSDLRQHIAQCPDCRAKYHSFQEIVAVLKPGIPIKAPVSVKKAIQDQIQRQEQAAQPARVIRRSTFWKKAAAVAAILVLSIASPFLIRRDNNSARASGLIMTAINASENIRNYVLLYSVRTSNNDDFEFIDPNQPMVHHTLLRSFDKPGAWSISKPGRKVIFDGESQYLYIPAAKTVYKGGPQAGFVSWMHLLLDPASILWKEEDIAKSRGARIQITQRNGDTCLTITTKATGDIINDRLRNDNIGTADSKSDYVFDGKTHLLKGLRISVLKEGKETLVFSIDKIVYDTTLAREELLFTVPDGAELKTAADLSPSQGGNLPTSSKEAARIALEDLSKGDLESHKQMWIEYGRFSLALLKRGYKGIEIVRIGEPFRSVAVTGDIVPYEIKFPGGFIKRFRLVLDNKNSAKIWMVKGGL